jgi:hypothetical protein
MLAILNGKGGAEFSDRLLALEALICRENRLPPILGIADSLLHLKSQFRSFRNKNDSNPPIGLFGIHKITSGDSPLAKTAHPSPDSALALSLPGFILQSKNASPLGIALLWGAAAGPSWKGWETLLLDSDIAALVPSRHEKTKAAPENRPDVPKENRTSGSPVKNLSEDQDETYPPETLLALVALEFSSSLLESKKFAEAEGVLRAIENHLPNHPTLISNLRVTLERLGKQNQTPQDAP